MNWYDAVEEAYKNGYAKGKEDAQKWIPVTERLPDYFGVFIISVRMPYRQGLFVDSADFDPFEKTWLPSMCWGKGYKVTHWMPLPEPPKGV